eukprot:gene7764-9108_t
MDSDINLTFIETIRSNDQSIVLNSYSELINYLKSNILEVLEASDFIVDFLTEKDTPFIEKLLHQLTTGFLGQEEKEIRVLVENIVGSIVRTEFGAQIVTKSLVKSIKSSDWTKREHTLVLLAMAVSASRIEAKSVVDSGLFGDIIMLVDDANGQISDESLGLIRMLYDELGRALFSTIKLDDIEESIVDTILDALELQRSDLLAPAPIKSKPLLQVQATTASRSISPLPPLPPSATTNNITTKPLKSTKNDPLEIFLMNQDLTPEEFEARTIEISAKLADSTLDWNLRLIQINKIQILLRSGAGYLPNFMSVFQKLKEPLLLQVTDLRSQIIKEACTTICTVAEQTKLQFEPHADRYIEVLLKYVVVTIQIVAESCDKCIKSILSETKSTKVIPRFVEALNTKSAVLKTRIHEYIHLLLTLVPAADLTRHIADIERAIKAGLVDAIGDVRSTSRQSFIIFSSNWEARANQIYATTDPAARKLIDRERGTTGDKQQQHIAGLSTSIIANTSLSTSLTNNNKTTPMKSSIASAKTPSKTPLKTITKTPVKSTLMSSTTTTTSRAATTPCKTTENNDTSMLTKRRGDTPLRDTSRVKHFKIDNDANINKQSSQSLRVLVDNNTKPVATAPARRVPGMSSDQKKTEFFGDVFLIYLGLLASNIVWDSSIECSRGCDFGNTGNWLGKYVPPQDGTEDTDLKGLKITGNIDFIVEPSTAEIPHFSNVSLDSASLYINGVGALLSDVNVINASTLRSESINEIKTTLIIYDKARIFATSDFPSSPVRLYAGIFAISDTKSQLHHQFKSIAHWRLLVH